MKSKSIHTLRMCYSVIALWISIFSPPSYAQSTETILVPTPTPIPTGFIPKLWQEDFYQSIMSRVDELEYRFTNALFDGGTSIDLFKTDLNNKNDISAAVTRDIFNNFDLMNTWTVIDRFKIKLDTSIYGYGIQNENISFPFLNVNFGASGILELRDMRQMSPQQVQKLSHDEEKLAEIKNEDIQELNPYLNASPLDSPIKVKFKDILNPVKIPLKIPFSRGDLRHMTTGEVISYNLTGIVGFGGSLGWKIIPNEVLSAGATLSVETHLKGEFQISVMKESDRYAKVRISKIFGNGQSVELKAGAELYHFYNGFFSFEKKPISIHLGQLSTSIVPFDFKVSREQDQEVDVGYRYDLDSQEGKDAYHKAMLGSFVQSENSAKEEIISSNPSVIKLFTRSSNKNLNSRSFGINLSLIFNSNSTRSTQGLSTIINLPDGTNHIFKSVEENSSNSSFINGNNEKKSQKMSVIVDHEGFIAKKEGSILIIAENMIDDTSSRAKEINGYTRDVEDTLQEKGIFPILPEFVPNEDHPNRTKKAFYGHSSFYYGFSIQEKGIESFLATDIKQVITNAEMLGVKFDQKSFLKARTAYLNRDPDLLYEALNKLFDDRKNVKLLSTLLIKDLDPSKYEKFLVAQNLSFGNIQNRGHHILSVEQRLQSTEVEMGIGSDTYRTVADPLAVVDQLKTEIGTDRKIQIHFNLSKTPEFLYFRMNPLTHRHHRKNATELIVYNRDQKFKIGRNTITLDPISVDELSHKLTSKLDSNEAVIFTMGFSQSGSKWGFGSSTQFITTPIYKNDSLNKN